MTNKCERCGGKPRFRMQVTLVDMEDPEKKAQHQPAQYWCADCALAAGELVLKGNRAPKPAEMPKYYCIGCQENRVGSYGEICVPCQVVTLVRPQEE